MKRPLLLRRWAAGGTRTPVPVEKYKEGFRVEKPDEYYLNEMQYDEESFFIANMETGIPTNGDDGVSYADRSIYFKDGKIYVRTSKGDKPSIVGGSYQSVLDKIAEFNRIFNAHTTNLSNPHKVTPAQTGTYSKTEFDALNTGQTDNLETHIKDFNNPHKVTFTQLNCLGAKEGGTFTGVVNFLDSISVGGSSYTVGGDSTSFTFGSSTQGIGLDATNPIADTPKGRQVLFHEGNYLTERNKLEPLYYVPPAVCIVPFKSSIHFLKGNNCLTSTWDDLSFTKDGLLLKGSLTFGEPRRLVANEQTIRFIPKDDVSVQIGSITISKKAGLLKVEDSGTEIWSGSKSGSITYARTATHGYVYVQGIRVADKAHAEVPVNLTASVSGSGHLKELYVWVNCLTQEQIANIA